MEENVLRGVALLDEKVPDWRERVNPDELEMLWRYKCILGQLFGYYGDGLKKLGIDDYNTSIKYGLEADTDNVRSPKWDILADLWKEQL